MTKKDVTQLPYEITGYAIKVHKELGPGLLESVYEKCLYYELLQNGYHVSQQILVPVGKYVTIHSPLNVTATLGWNYSALVRYTYANTGISTTIPYVNRTHTKFIGPFTDF